MGVGVAVGMGAVHACLRAFVCAGVSAPVPAWMHALACVHAAVRPYISVQHLATGVFIFTIRSFEKMML